MNDFSFSEKECCCYFHFLSFDDNLNIQNIKKIEKSNFIIQKQNLMFVFIDSKRGTFRKYLINKEIIEALI
jgi:hypothetical protein